MLQGARWNKKKIVLCWILNVHVTVTTLKWSVNPQRFGGNGLN